MKKDINIGEVVSNCSKIQLQLESAKNAVSKNGLRLDKLFNESNDENKRSFLHHILIRPTKWESIVIGECVFNDAFHKLSCNDDVLGEQMSPECKMQCEKLLFHLANFEFSVSVTGQHSISGRIHLSTRTGFSNQ